MANNIASGLKRAVILKSAMEAFKHRLVSLGLFSTVFRDVPLEGSNDIEVPYYPLETAASKDYDGSYKFDEGDLESRKVTVNRRKYQSLTYTSEEKARQPYFDPEQLGRLKGAKLAEDVLCDILSCVTSKNFGAAAVTANADEFDADKISKRISSPQAEREISGSPPLRRSCPTYSASSFRASTGFRRETKSWRDSRSIRVRYSWRFPR